MKTLKMIISLLLIAVMLCSCVEAPAVNDDVLGNDSNVHIDPDTEEPVDSEDTPIEELPEEAPIVEPDYDVDLDDIDDPIYESPVEQPSQTSEASNDEFKITLHSSKTEYSSSENIEIEATISLISGEKLTVWSGDPILGFSLSGDTCFENEQGSAITMDILKSTTFTNAEDMLVPYQKSGGFSASDPNADFYDYFFSDFDSFKLPAGNYTVTAYLNYSLDSDDVIGTSRTLKTSVDFSVFGTAFEDLDYPKLDSIVITDPESETITEDIVVEDGIIEPLSYVQQPEMTPYPEETNVFDWSVYEQLYSAWRQDKTDQLSVEGRGDGVDNFVKTSISEILKDASGKNKIYSPVNVYMALCMLAEIADGETRNEVLSLLGEDSIEAVRASANAVWNHNFCADGAVTSILGASVWLDDGIDMIEDTAEILADSYYTESYNCDIGSEDMLKAYKAWLNKQTGGLLKDAVENTQIDPEAIMVLATTLYYSVKWDVEFYEANNSQRTFNLLDDNNTSIECEFMNESNDGSYYYSDNFSAVKKRFNEGGGMWFILPDSDVSIDQLLDDEAVLDLIVNNGKNCDSTYLMINLSVPKFDVSSDISLKEDLENLGVHKAFERGEADFSNLTDSIDGNVWLDGVKHVARVKIDEEGVEAAAYTEMVLCGDALPPEETVDFVLDRPFIFAITGESGDILFVGVVNNPVE